MLASLMNLIAQTTQQTTTGAGAGGQNTPPPDSGIWLIGLMFAAIIFMMVMSSGKRKKEEAKRNDMMSNLKKNDRVMTIGGIVGIVVQVHDSEVVVKVDESTNTKMTFTKDAIRQVIDPTESK